MFTAEAVGSNVPGELGPLKRLMAGIQLMFSAAFRGR
jgi:hypothetical protein